MILFDLPKKISSKQRFIQTLEGLGDVLEAAVRSRKTVVVTAGLEQLKRLFDEVQDLRTTDIKRFERLILSDQLMEMAEKNLERARFELGFDPKRHAVGLHTLIDQFLKIHSAAVENKNDELSRLSVYQLNYVLARAASYKGNGLVVEQLLDALMNAAITALKKNDRSVYAAAVHWYTDIIFNRLSAGERKFELEYLPLFNKRFFQLAKLLVRENHAQLFEELVGTLIDGIMPDLHWEESFWKAAHFVQDQRYYHEVDPNSYQRRLAGLIAGGLTQDELAAGRRIVDEMAAVIRPYLTAGQDTVEFEKTVQKTLESLEDRLKFDDLTRLVAAVGSYCVFKSAEPFVKSIWEYKQPHDADASYVGHDIVPDSPDRIFALFYSGQGLSRSYDLHENHHGSETYYEQYLVLLLVRLIDLGNEGQLQSNADPIYLHRIADRVDRLKERAAKLAVGEQWRSLFIKPKAELFDKVGAWLDEAKASAGRHLDEYVVKSPISPDKIAEFRANFRKEFDKENPIRKLLIQHGAFRDLTDTLSPERTRAHKRERNDISEKEPFLPSWYAHYSEWGIQYGRGYALTEGEHLISTLLKSLPVYSPTDIGKGPQALEALTSSVRFLESSGYSPSVIFTAFDMEAMADLRNAPDYLPHWHQDCPKSDIHGYHGCLRYRGRLIPIFWASQQLQGKACIVDLGKLGTWSQFSPIEDPADAVSRVNEFIIRVESLEQNEVRLQEVIAKKPPFLDAHADKRGYLLRRVLITTRESFEYQLADPKAGVQVLLKKTNETQNEGEEK